MAGRTWLCAPRTLPLVLLAAVGLLLQLPARAAGAELQLAFRINGQSPPFAIQAGDLSVPRVSIVTIDSSSNENAVTVSGTVRILATSLFASGATTATQSSDRSGRLPSNLDELLATQDDYFKTQTLMLQMTAQSLAGPDTYLLAASVNVTFYAGPPTGLVSSHSPSTASPLPVGTDITITLEARDANNNRVASGPNAAAVGAQITVTGGIGSTTVATDPATGLGSYSFTSQRPGTFNAVVTASSPSTITVSGSEFVSVTFTAGPVSKFVFNALGYQSVDQGEAAAATLRAFDRFDNFVNTEARRVLINTNASVTSGAGQQQFAAGVLSLSILRQDPGVVRVSLAASVDSLDGVDLSATVDIVFAKICDGVTEYNDVPHQIVCKSVRAICPIGEFQSAASTRTSDRVCTACNGLTEYQDQTNQTSCKSMSSACTAGQYQDVAPTATADRVCLTCDGVSEYQDLPNQPSCKTITVCQAGSVVTAEPTASSDRSCQLCPAGSVDADSNPDSPCELCMQNLVSTATFGARGVLAGTVSFAQPTPADNVTVTIALSQIPTSARNFTILAAPAAAGHPCPVAAGVFDPTNALAQQPYQCGAPGTSSAAACAVGDVAARLPMLDGSQSSLSVSLSVAHLYLSDGTRSIDGLALALLDASGNAVDCASLSVPTGGTYQDAQGQTSCKTAATCTAGQERSQAPTRSSDRVCSACNGLTEYQDEANQAFCKPVTVCATGLEQDLAPNATFDRTCKTVLCDGLAAPQYAAISPDCSGTQVFGAACTYSCNATDGFQLDLSTATDAAATRVCVKDPAAPGGIFNGSAPGCACQAGTVLVPHLARCQPQCPDEYYAVNGVCEQCTSPCDSGEFEATPCSQVNNTDRVCTVCSACPLGKFASGGCFATNATDTICSNFTDCAVGFYETFAGNSTVNRKCDACTPCDPAYSFLATGCCASHDSVCQNLTVCATDEYEVAAPVLDGGFLTSDRVCRKRRTCTAREILVFAGNATSDAVCQACTQCPAGSYETAACSGTQDTVCSSWTTCNPTTEYEARPGGPYTDRECLRCSNCSSHEYKSGGCDGYNNTVCTLLSVCDIDTEYQAQAPTATSDRVCATCTVCNATTETMVTACSRTADTNCTAASGLLEDCPRATVRIGNPYANPRTDFCKTCDPCPAGYFPPNGIQCLDLGFRAPDCVAHTVCADGQYEVQAPTSTSDRICKTCTPCGPNAYRSGGCTGTTDAICTPWKQCPSGQYKYRPGTALEDLTCQACTACATGTYASGVCQGWSNTVCSVHAQCSTKQALLNRGTKGSNAVCTACGARAAGRADSAFLCPASPDDLCGASTPTTTPTGAPTPVPVPPSGVRVSFSFPYDFVSVIGPLSASARIQVFIAALKTYLQQLLGLDAAQLINFTATNGSIIVTGDIVDNAGSPSAASAAASLASMVGDGSFTFTFEDLELSTSNSSFASQASAASSSSDFPTAVVAGVIGGVVLVALIVVLMLAVVRRRNAERDAVGPVKKGKSVRQSAPGSKKGSMVPGDEYLTVDEKEERRRSSARLSEQFGFGDENDSPFAPTTKTNPLFLDTDAADTEEVVNNPLFNNQLTQEEERVEMEKKSMTTRVSEKNSSTRQQRKARAAAEKELDREIAAKLGEQNKHLKQEIAQMKEELRSKKASAKFQSVAAEQLRLKAERAALEEELSRLALADQMAEQMATTLAVAEDE